MKYFCIQISSKSKKIKFSQKRQTPPKYFLYPGHFVHLYFIFLTPHRNLNLLPLIPLILDSQGKLFEPKEN